MERFASLAEPGRGPGYIRAALRQDVLYNSFRFRDVTITVSKKLLAATRINDSFVERMRALGIITPEAKAVYDKAALEALSHMDQLDHLSAEALYHYIHGIRKAVLGVDAIEAFQALQAREDTGFSPDGIDQRPKKARLMARCDTVLFAITQAELFPLLRSDIEQARALGKQLRLLCGQPGDALVSKHLLAQWLGAEAVEFWEDAPARLPENACLLVYGEEGLTACRSLVLDAVVHAVPTGFAAQAVTGLWSHEPCLVYIPAGLDITAHVPLTQKARVTYSHLARLWQDHGDAVYGLSAEELYRGYPEYFLNVYDLTPSRLPIKPVFEDGEDTFSQFDRQLDEGLQTYLGSFENVEFHSAYFDETLRRRPIRYDPSQKQPGILVQAARIKRAEGAQVLQCKKGVTPRQMFRRMALPGTALVSNFLFFMTPKLGVLYNDLRDRRPYEQADAASGHLDYMLAYRDGKRIETFPLFGKTCIAMTDDGSFLFCNFFLGGGQVDISGIRYRWKKSDVNAENDIRIYTPFHSAADKEADRDTYRKYVGQGRVNVVILREKVTCVRRGDVILPSVGVVLSLSEADAAPLLQKLQPLEDGYYDVSGLELTVQLDPPEGVDPEAWARIRWAYGGGLTLVRKGIGLCDGDHMQDWFDSEGWSSPLSRQTQESNLHSLVKHPRTAIGCTESGALVVLVYSGRTWRSTGADYREMIAIARQLFPDIQYLMNCDGGGSAMLGMVQDGSFLELSCPSTSSGSCAGQVRPINTVFYIPAGERKES